jgi:hypothetical protein
MIEPLASNNPALEELRTQRTSEKDGRETSQSTLPPGDTANISPEAQNLLTRLDKVRQMEEGAGAETGDPRHEETEGDEGMVAQAPEAEAGPNFRDITNETPAIVDQIADFLDE